MDRILDNWIGCIYSLVARSLHQLFTSTGDLNWPSCNGFRLPTKTQGLREDKPPRLDRILDRILDGVLDRLLDRVLDTVLDRILDTVLDRELDMALDRVCYLVQSLEMPIQVLGAF